MKHTHRLSVWATLFALCGLLAVSVSAAGGVLGGTGTPSDPYTIEDAADLAAFRDLVNATPSSTANAVLTADIDLENEPWKRIYPDSGYITEAYAGTFDGDGHTITGLYINETTADQGLFGAIGLATADGETVTAVIKNLKVEGQVDSSGNYVGGIVGRVNAGSVINCSFDGSVTSSKKNASLGGIVGYINGDKPEKKPTVVLSGCVNRATVSSETSGTVAGGIVGYAKYASITDCYNLGSIAGMSRTGGIGGQLQNNVAAANCYTAHSSEALVGFLYSSSSLTECFGLGAFADAGTGTVTDCAAIDPDNKAELLSLLDSAFAADEDDLNGGYPLLAWEKGEAPAPKEPSVALASATLHLTAGDTHPTTTLTVIYKDMDAEEVVWSIEDGAEVIELIAPENPNAADSTRIVRALAPGKATVKVQTADGAYSATSEILCIPQLTGRQIAGTVAVGFTVEAKITVLGGKEYDYDNYPTLEFQWKYLTEEEYLSGQTGADSYHLVDNGTERTFTIPASLEGCYLSYTVLSGASAESPSSPVRVRSNAVGAIEADKAALVLDTALPIKEATALSLPTAGENGTEIAWSSDNASVIDPTDGTVTLPKKGIATVTLTATFSKDGESTEKTFVFTVYSKAAIEEEQADKASRLSKILRSLRKSKTFKPIYGEDVNVTDMLLAKLAALDGSDITACVSKVETVYDGAAIDENGDITYFYADPRTAPARHSATLRVTFTLSLDEVSDTFTATVVVPWDAERVKELMREELVDKTDIETASPITDSFTLPAKIDENAWALVSWTSSDPSALSVTAGANKTEPMTAVPHRGMDKRDVTLTAAYTFGFTSTDEPEIVLYKTFDCTVAPLDAEELEAIRETLSEKLASGFEKAGLRDAHTGDALVETDGVYTVSGDILYPTTSDFGVDGKLTPVTITSQNEALIPSPDTANAARTEVYRPAVGEETAHTTVTVTLTDKESGVAVSKELDFAVLPLTEEEIEAERALLERVCEAYFDGLRGKNTTKENIRYDLKPFLEVYEADGELVWVYDSASTVGHGIVPTALDGWEELEAWRLFRSSNPSVITHENLLVSLQNKAKAVTIDSVLSSETLGRYGKLYRDDPEAYAKYEALSDLYARPVSAELVVRGKYTSASVTAPTPVVETATVSFTLKDGSKSLLSEKVKELPEGTTVFDVFKKVLEDNGYTYVNRGGYIASVTKADGTVLEEMGAGPYSGWMFKVNGEFPDTYMSGCGIEDGDKILVFYTYDYNKEFEPVSSGSSTPRPSTSTDDDASTDETSDTDAPSESEKSEGSEESKETENTEDTKETEKSEETEKDNVPDVSRFTDLEKHWALTAIEAAVRKGLMKGVSDTLFAPDDTLTRAMFVTILHRAVGEPKAEAAADFADVAADAWYAEAVAWAVENGVIKGVGEREFAPDEPITREQMALILYRHAGEKAQGDVSLPFTDLKDCSEEVLEAVAWAYEKGILRGMGEVVFAPKETATRAQAATVLTKLTDAI